MYKVASAANVKSPGEKVCVGSNFGFKKREGERKGEGKMSDRHGLWEYFVN